MCCLDDYLSFLPTELLTIIARYLDVFSRAAVSSTCTRLSHISSLIPEFPLPISSVSKHNEVNMKLQYYFQKCLSSLPPVPNAIKKRLPMMYNHLRIQNVFRHLLNCGLEGCHLCKPTEQWSDIIPKNVYNYYLRNMQAHHVSSCKTMEQLEAYIESYGDSYNYDLKQFYRYIYQLLQGVGQRHYCFNDVTLSDCIYPVHEELVEREFQYTLFLLPCLLDRLEFF